MSKLINPNTGRGFQEKDKQAKIVLPDGSTKILPKKEDPPPPPPKMTKQEIAKLFRIYAGYNCPYCKSKELTQRKMEGKGTTMGICINGHAGMWSEFETGSQSQKDAQELSKKLIGKEKKKDEARVQVLQKRLKFESKKLIEAFCADKLPAEDLEVMKSKTASDSDRQFVLHKHGLSFRLGKDQKNQYLVVVTIKEKDAKGGKEDQKKTYHLPIKLG